MLTALKNSQKIQQLSLDLLRLSLAGEDSDYWQTYESLIQTFGYNHIIVNGRSLIIRQHQQQNYTKYKHLMTHKISKIEELQRSEIKRFWQSQIKDSDKFQCLQNLYYCTLTPVNFMLNMQIHQHKDFKFSPYAFINGDSVIYSNSCAQKKGILQGLPVILAQKIDPQTKLIQVSKQMNTKWGQLVEILSEKYKGVELINNGYSIHFILRQQSKAGENDRKILEQQISLMIEDIFSISGVRMFGIVSRSEMVCELIAKSISLHSVTHVTGQPIILLSKPEIQSHLGKLSNSILPFLSMSHVRLLNEMNITTIKQVLENLWILQIVLSKEQAKIIMQTCLGFDYRQDKWYIEQKNNEFTQVGLSYQDYVKNQDTKNSTIQGLNVVKNNLLGQKEKVIKIQQESDMQSIKSQRVNNIQSRHIQKQSRHIQKQSKSQNNYKSTSLIGKQQQSLTGFIKKTKK